MDDVQGGPGGALGVVFIGDGVAEVGEDAVAKEAGDLAAVAGNGGTAAVPVLLDGGKVVFHVEAFAEGGGADEVDEHDGERPALDREGWRIGGEGGKEAFAVAEGEAELPEVWFGEGG